MGSVLDLIAVAIRALRGDPLSEIEAEAVAILDTVDANPNVATAVAELLDAARRRDAVEQALRDGTQQLAEAQRIGRMGSYDWDIVSDTNTWSDELYRIYGTEPQSFNASYERFLEFIHPDDRARVVAIHQHAYDTGEPYQMEERIVRPDGEERVLVSWGEVVADEAGTPARMRGICLDVTDERRAEREAEAMSLRLHDIEVRRRHALEINDNVVQGLAASIYAFEMNRTDLALASLRETLTSARIMMNDLLIGTADGFEPGELTRARPAPGMDTLVTAADDAPRSPEPPTQNTRRVVLIDDAAAVRLLLRCAIDTIPGYEVVGEAADGKEGVELVRQARPDIAIVDLAMPVMDGLAAIPLILEGGTVKVVALSGFDRDRMEPAARAAGAHAYLEKGSTLTDMASVLAALH